MITNLLNHPSRPDRRRPDPRPESTGGTAPESSDDDRPVSPVFVRLIAESQREQAEAEARRPQALERTTARPYSFDWGTVRFVTRSSVPRPLALSVATERPLASGLKTPGSPRSDRSDMASFMGHPPSCAR